MSLFILVISEVGTRVLSSKDADGNYHIRQKKLRPYRLPIEESRITLERYKKKLEDNPSEINYLYHNMLGWIGNPKYKESNIRNEQAIRAPGRVFSYNNCEDTLRIAIFGDSFTQSSPLNYEETWGYLLEKGLCDHGFPAEVLNFGVGGYGIDQAYLRWEVDGRQYNPDYVVLGFYPYNIGRNMYIFRSCGMVFTKPRFIDNGDSLILVNYPVVPLNRIVSELQIITTSELGRYDSYWQNHLDDYSNNWWRYSKFFSFIETNVKHNRLTRFRSSFDQEYFDFNKEAAPLTIKIIKRFKESVHNDNAEFIILNIPTFHNVYNLKRDSKLNYVSMVDSMKRIAPVIQPESSLVKYAKDHDIMDLYTDDKHHAEPGDSILALHIMDFLITKLTHSESQQKEKETEIEEKIK